jgi:hypothetical protein
MHSTVAQDSGQLTKTNVRKDIQEDECFIQEVCCVWYAACVFRNIANEDQSCANDYGSVSIPFCGRVFFV